MSAIGTALTPWDEFAMLPDAEDGIHLELHDGEVIEMPPGAGRPFLCPKLLTRWLTARARGSGWAAQKFPYRPAANLQFWYADVGYMPKEDWQALRGKDYAVFAPSLVIEVLSPSNKPAKIARQRNAAFSAGTREFWCDRPRPIEPLRCLCPVRCRVCFKKATEYPSPYCPASYFP